MLKLGTWGFGPHPWVSVERGRGFYRRALEPIVDLVDLDAGPAEVDAVFSFHSSRWHQQRHRPETPIVLVMHGGPVVDHHELRELLPALRERDTLIVNCEADVEVIESLCEVPPRLVILPLPVDTDVFTPYEPAECRAEFGIPPEVAVLGFVARLVPQKNFHGFLRVLAAVQRELAPRPVHAVVVGTYAERYPILDYGCGAYVDTTRALVEELGLGDRLHYYAARLSDDQLAAAYCSMDLLVHPTQAIDENFGFVPVEAMACGVPVVGAAYGGLRDTIVPGETGALIPTWASHSGPRMDLDAAVPVIAALLDDPQRRLELASNAVERVHARYRVAHFDATLRATIDQACSCTDAGPPLRMRPRPSLPALDLLPLREPPYAAFHEPISHYVSDPIPRLDPRKPGRKVRWACGLRRDASGQLVLDDPTWPAAVELDPRDRAWLELGTRARPASELAAPNDPAWARLQALVDRGLMIPETPVLT